LIDKQIHNFFPSPLSPHALLWGYFVSLLFLELKASIYEKYGKCTHRNGNGIGVSGWSFSVLLPLTYAKNRSTVLCIIAMVIAISIYVVNPDSKGL